MTHVHLNQNDIINFEDEDGCPDIPPYTSDIDSDGDGILNSVDQCPTSKRNLQ